MLSFAPTRGLLAILTLAAAGLFAAPQVRAEAPAAYMQRVANELVAAQRSGSAQSYASVIRSHADVPTIGLTALGSYASALPKGDRPTYYNGMINFIARYAAKEGPKYPVARAIMVGQSSESGSGASVDSRITLRTGESYDVRWILVRRGAVYKVRDAEVIGFRMTSFLDTLFQNYISENGGNPKSLVLALSK